MHVGTLAGTGEGAPPHRSVRPRPTSSWELIQDLIASFRAPGYWVYGAWLDISLRYRSHALGAFWMIAGTLVFVGVLGSLYSRVLAEGANYYFGHIACGYVFWILILRALQTSSRIYSTNRNMIQNGYVNYTDYVLRMFAELAIILAHNFIVVVLAMVFTPIPLTWAALALLFTVPLFFVTVLGSSFLVSIIGARYSDFGEFLQSVLRLGFFVTPIIWSAESGKGALIGAFLYLNPFYYLIEIVRAPLIYGRIPWLEIGATAVMALIVWTLASKLYARAKPYIPLWI